MKLLVTGAWREGQQHIEALRKLGHEVLFLPQEADALPCGYGWVEGVICNGLFLHHPIEQFSNLRYIQLTSAGVYSVPMAEFAVSGVLQLYKQARLFYENQKAHRWEKQHDLL